MKAQFNTKWTINTIRMSLFVATHVNELKGSKMWTRANQLLNWLEQFDNEDDLIAFSNTPIKFEEDEQ